MQRPSVVWFLWGAASVLAEGLLGRRHPLDPELSFAAWLACCIGFGGMLGLLRGRLPAWVAFSLPGALVFPEVLRAAGTPDGGAAVGGVVLTIVLALVGRARRNLDGALAALVGLGLIASTLLRPMSPFRVAPPDFPKVLMISVDTVRSDVGLLDDPGFSPQLGFHHYSNAFSAAPWTLPAMLSVLWGEPVSDHGGGLLGPGGPSQPAPPKRVWRGIALLSNPWLSPERGFGLVAPRIVHEEASREPLLLLNNVVGFLNRWMGIRSQTKLDLDQRLEHATLDAIGAGESVIWVHLLAPHEYARGCEACSVEEKKRRYAAAVSETRHRLLRLVGAAPEHVVVILADHGEAFGELGVWGHGHQLQDAELHVPLAIRIPGEIGRIHPEVIGTAEVGAWILRLQAGELAHPVSAPDGSGSAEVAGARGAAGLRAVRNADGRYLPLPAFRAGPPLELSDEEADRLRAFGYLDRPSP